MPFDLPRVAVWEGWSLEVPEGFVTARNPDGSWSAWNDALVVDVHTLSTAGTESGPTPAATMLGAPGYGHGWTEVLTIDDGEVLGRAYFVREDDERGEVWWLHSEVATTNRTMLCSVGMRDPAERGTAENIVKSIRYSRESDERLA